MAAIVGSKGSVQVYVGTTETLTASDKLAHVTTITFPQTEAEEIDVTDFDSEGKETENGTKDYGNLEITQHLVADEYDNMQDKLDEDTMVYWQAFTLNKAGDVVIGRKGKGYVKTVAPEGLEVDNAFTVQTTIKVYGKTSKVETLPSA